MARVRTVTGEIDSAELGPTIFHEHILLDGRGAWRPPAEGDEEGARIAQEPVSMEFLGRLREDPYLSLHNTSLDDVDTAVDELDRFALAGGRTVVDVTPAAVGRDPHALRTIAERTGLNIIMSCGYYLERTHAPEVAELRTDELADRIAADVTDGVDGVHAGVIGEVGVGMGFTPAEERILRASARAQVRTGVPLAVHLPGWLRHGDRVLDICEEEGANLDATVLAHMNPSWIDPAYQFRLADRGAWLGYDMLGMEFYYPGEGQSPSDEENAAAIARLIKRGYAGRLLLGHDVFLKTLLCRYGGRGYAHVLTGFADRLERHGVPRDVLMGVLTDNPRALFELAADGRGL